MNLSSVAFNGPPADELSFGIRSRVDDGRTLRLANGITIAMA
jgi:hypothetical protein